MLNKIPVNILFEHELLEELIASRDVINAYKKGQKRGRVAGAVTGAKVGKKLGGRRPAMKQMGKSSNLKDTLSYMKKNVGKSLSKFKRKK